MASVQLDGGGASKLTLRGVNIWKLTATGITCLDLKDCEIGDLTTESKAKYYIRNCMIGNFHAGGGRPIQRLEWTGGYLGQFHLHEDTRKAFVGDVWFRDAQLPLDPNTTTCSGFGTLPNP